MEKLNSQELWYFICERWLAVEEDDGRVDRILPVANEKELTHFQHLFVSKTVKELGDGHLWFSVFTRPPASTFTRLQRLSCCLSLLCCTMITNAMFYNLGGAANSQSNYVIMIGSLTIDYRSLIIGIQSSLIIFPVNLALVQIFRNVRPKEHKTTPQSEQQRVSKGSASSRSSGDVSISNVCLQKAEANETKKRGIPHCWLYFAWALCFLSSVSAAIFTVFYSLSWGPEIANEWLLTFVLSFFQSILVIQPVKVVFAAIFFALVIKKPVAQEEGKSQRDPSLDTLTEERATEAIFEIEDNFRYRYDFRKLLRAFFLKTKNVGSASVLNEWSFFCREYLKYLTYFDIRCLRLHMYIKVILQRCNNCITNVQNRSAQNASPACVHMTSVVPADLRMKNFLKWLGWSAWRKLPWSASSKKCWRFSSSTSPCCLWRMATEILTPTYWEKLCMKHLLSLTIPWWTWKRWESLSGNTKSAFRFSRHFYVAPAITLTQK